MLKTRIAVFVSGGGTNLQALLDAQAAGKIPSGEIVLVAASNPKAYALERAARAGVKSVVVERRACGSQEAFEDALRAPDGQGGPSVQGVAEGSQGHGPFEGTGQDIPEVTRADEASPPNPSEDPVYGIPEGSRVDGIGGTMRIESPSGTQAVEGRTDAVQTDDMQELARLLERVGGGNASATELYQLQFLVGMLRVQATGGAKLSQQVNQGFESLLKQQG